MTERSRLDAEWITLSAVRGLTQVASQGDMSKATYSNAMDFGAQLYPELLGAESSILRRARESDLAREYRQRAILESIRQASKIEAITLLEIELKSLETLLELSKKEKHDQKDVDQLKRKLGNLKLVRKELLPEQHTENQLIFRDAYAVSRTVPALGSGKSYRDFQLPDSKILRVRVLHPDKPEHITGADIIYERHHPAQEKASIVAVQYKIWEDKRLSLNNSRLQSQLTRLRAFTCALSVCDMDPCAGHYRFPCCSAFIRPTDKLQSADQEFISSGEHLPVCLIDACMDSKGTGFLELKNMRGTSLSSQMFEQLFNQGKIGSRYIGYPKLTEMYSVHQIASADDTVILYAQEFTSDSA